MNSIIVSEVFAPQALAKLKSLGTHNVLTPTNEKELHEALTECEILIIRSRTRIDQNLLLKCPQLRLIVTATSGFDHINFEECRKRQIHMAYTPSANAQSTAELTLALILNLLRHLPMAAQAASSGAWRKHIPRGHELKGMHLGIVGLGRVGQKVAKLGHAFGMRVHACDPYLEADVFKELQVEPLALSELFHVADVLTLHVPLTRETRHMINAQTLRSMNSDAYLINAARGELVNEAELCLALDEGLLRGAALDVFEREPLAKDSRLLKRANVLLSPHIGAYTESALLTASLETVDCVAEFLRTEKVKDPLPSHLPWFPLTKWPKD